MYMCAYIQHVYNVCRQYVLALYPLESREAAVMAYDMTKSDIFMNYVGPAIL